MAEQPPLGGGDVRIVLDGPRADGQQVVEIDHPAIALLEFVPLVELRERMGSTKPPE